MMQEVEEHFDDEDEGDAKEGERKKSRSIKKTSDLIRFKLDKLMDNFEKPVNIPERVKPRPPPVVPDFVRNVMGSSAGAGSGEFHVYRHLRRKEYARQKFIQNQSRLEELDAAFKKKLEDNAQSAADKTAKKRARRLKRKGNVKEKKLKGEPKNDEKDKVSSNESEEDEIVEESG